jgi:hypothetical protein
MPLLQSSQLLLRLVFVGAVQVVGWFWSLALVVLLLSVAVISGVAAVASPLARVSAALP